MDETQQPAETTVSLAKIEANRRNALRSTGPRTERGKANIRFNAVKHGFLSKQLVVSSNRVGENPKEFESLLHRLMQHYAPANVAEEVQVEIIAICLWRDRRLLRYELEQATRAGSEGTEQDPIPAASDRDPAGILRLLRQAEQDIDKEGDFSPETKSTVASLFGWEIPAGLGIKDLKEIHQRQERILREIREMIRNYEGMGQDTKQAERALVEDGYPMPDTEAFDRILRYQAVNDRRLHRALSQLERLQRQRQGDYVPAPVKVSLEAIE